MEEYVLYITKEGEVFKLQGGEAFLKGEFLNFNPKKEGVRKYSPNFRSGTLVAIKTKEQFSKHFLIKESKYDNLFSVHGTSIMFFEAMSKYSGKIFRVRKEDDTSDTYLSEENGGFYFHADMLVNVLSIYEEV